MKADSDHVLAVERPLGGSLAQVEALAYLRPRKPLTAQRSNADSINLGARPSEFLTFGVVVPRGGLPTLSDKRARSNSVMALMIWNMRRSEGVSAESRRGEYALHLNGGPLAATRCGDAQFVEFAGDLPQRGRATLAYLFNDR